jgi:hypothetical protein
MTLCLAQNQMPNQRGIPGKRRDVSYREQALPTWGMVIIPTFRDIARNFVRFFISLAHRRFLQQIGRRPCPRLEDFRREFTAPKNFRPPSRVTRGPKFYVPIKKFCRSDAAPSLAFTFCFVKTVHCVCITSKPITLQAIS